MQVNLPKAVILTWLLVAITLAFALIAIGLTLMIGARRAPREFPPYLLLFPLVSLAMNLRAVEWAPLPDMLDTALRLVGVALIYYFLYRSGPMLKNWTRQRFGWPNE